MTIFQLSGVHTKHHKNTASMAPVRMPVPPMITVPMRMHIGAPAVPCVKAGDRVKVGQMIGAMPERGLCSPIFSGVSGTVKKVDETIASDGSRIPTVIIESDGEQTVYEGITPPVITDRKDFLAAMVNSGIVGLGGAGFPTAVKLAADIEKIDTVVINGAECEPYITSDTRTMLDKPELVAEGPAPFCRRCGHR